MESPESQLGAGGGATAANSQEKENLCRVFRLWFDGGGLQPRARICISQCLFGALKVAAATAAAAAVAGSGSTTGTADVGTCGAAPSGEGGLFLQVEAVGSGKLVCRVQMNQTATVEELFAKLATYNPAKLFLGHGGPEIIQDGGDGTVTTLQDAGLTGEVPITMMCVPVGPGSVRVAKMAIHRSRAVMVAGDTLEALRLFIGDVVCLTSFNGKETAVAIVLQDDLPENTIRAGRELRANLDVNVGSWITISEQKRCAIATTVIILPFADSLTAAGVEYTPEEMFSQYLEPYFFNSYLCVETGSRFVVHSVGFNQPPLEFKVVSVAAEGGVGIVAPRTVIHCHGGAVARPPNQRPILNVVKSDLGWMHASSEKDGGPLIPINVALQ